MNVGDKVNWDWHTTRGYGYRRSVAAVIVKINPKTVRVKTAYRVRKWSSPVEWSWGWEIVFRNVQPQFLTPRMGIVPEVDGTAE